MSTYPTTPIPPVAINALEWMSGSWIEEAEHRRCDEIWSSPDADTLMGMFRWISEEDVSFYEFMVIKPTEEGVELHVKHFHPTLVAWEERERFQAFVLAEVNDQRAVFAAKHTDEDPETETGWVIYELADDDRLTVRLIEASGEAKLTFVYEREA